METRNSYTVPLSNSDILKLQEILEEKGFEFVDKKPHTLYCARNQNTFIAVYEKGPKILVQGKGASDFVEFVLEGQILEVGSVHKDKLADFRPHFGVDESGKGDFLGPLVIAGVYADKESAQWLSSLGIMDSKRIQSKAKIFRLAEKIQQNPKIVFKVILISPRRYNEMYEEFQNLNSLLAWGHSQTYASLAELVPDCHYALSDQFANRKVLESFMKKKKLKLILEQRHRAEEDIIVASASILARHSFLKWMNAKTRSTGIDFALGASEKVIEAGKHLKKKYGKENLQEYVKMHFKTLQEIQN